MNPSPVPKNVFLRLMHIAGKCVQFSFNNTIYQQVDGISMNSLLGAALSNILIGFQEERWFKITNKPVFYRQYYFFLKVGEKRLFFTHPTLTFICEFEIGNRLLFLDVFVERTNLGIQTSIYSKPIFTGSCS